MYLSMKFDSLLDLKCRSLANFFDLRVNANRFDFTMMTDKMNTYAYERQNEIFVIIKRNENL